jgi:hypothetical protein
MKDRSAFPASFVVFCGDLRCAEGKFGIRHNAFVRVIKHLSDSSSAIPAYRLCGDPRLTGWFLLE